MTNGFDFQGIVEKVIATLMVTIILGVAGGVWHISITVHDLVQDVDEIDKKVDLLTQWHAHKQWEAPIRTYAK